MIRAAVAALTLLFAAPTAAFECHTALILALDASDSVDPQEADLQRKGIATALRDDEVISALVPTDGYGALFMAFEWTDPGETQMIAEWTVLDSREAVAGLASVFERPVRAYMNGQTGIGAALEFAANAHRRAPVRCGRRVIDVSGDGPGNIGPTPDLYRKQGLFNGLIINGLVIRDVIEDYALQQPTRDPLPYYRDFVRHGPGSFIVVTANYQEYAEAMRDKLLKELQPNIAELAQ